MIFPVLIDVTVDPPHTHPPNSQPISRHCMEVCTIEEGFLSVKLHQVSIGDFRAPIDLIIAVSENHTYCQIK